MKFLGMILKLLLALVVLVAIGVVALLSFFDPNDYKDEIAKLVRQETGRDVNFGGPLSLSVYPWLALQAEDVTFGNAPDFGPSPMARVQHVSVGIRLLPLLDGMIVAQEVEVDGLALYLQRDASGQSNWDDLAALVGSKEHSPHGSGGVIDDGKDVGDDDVKVPTQFSLAGCSGQRVNVIWDDQVSDMRAEVSNATITLGEVRMDAPVNVDAAFNFSLSEPALEGHLSLSGILAFDFATQQFASSNLEVDLELGGEAVPSGSMKATLLAEQLRTDIIKETASITSFQLDAYGATIKGSLSVRNMLKDLGASGVVELEQSDLRKSLEQVRQSLTTIELPRMAAEDALSSVSGTVKFDYRPERLSVPFVDLVVDGQPLKGDCMLNLVRSSYNFTLASPGFDLDRYLPPEGNATKGHAPVLATQNAVAETDQDTLPETVVVAEDRLAPLRHLELDGGVDFGRLRIKGMEFSDVKLRVLARNGVMATDPVRVKLHRDNDVFALETSRIIADLHQGTARVDRFRLDGPGGVLTGRLQGSHLLDAPAIKGEVSMEKLNGRQLAEALAIELPATGDSRVFSYINGRAEFGYSSTGVEAPNFDLTVDDSRLKGFFRMAGSDPVAYSFSLSADVLDLDRYLPPRTKDGTSGQRQESSSKTGGGSSEGGGTVDQDEPRDLLTQARLLEARGGVAIGKLTVSGETFSDVRGNLRAGDGIITLDPLSAKLEGGKLELVWKLDATTAQGNHRLDATIQGLRCGALLSRFAGIDDVKGTLTMRTTNSFTWSGMDADGLKRSLSGTAPVTIHNGVFPGMDVVGMLSVVDSIATVLEGKDGDSTEFGEAKGTIVAKSGVVRCDDLCLKSPGLRATGEGHVNLATEEIDYLIKALGVTDSHGQGGKACSEYYGVPMPVRISGTFDNPRYWVSGPEYAASVAKGVVGLASDVVVGSVEAVGSVIDTVLGTNLSGDTEGAPKGENQEDTTVAEDVVEGVIEGGEKTLETIQDGIESLF